MSDDAQNAPISRIQLSGILYKPPYGHQSSKLSKRFFVVMDGFLIYYLEAEKKEFEKRRTLNHHPKGIVPLGGCTVQPMSIPTHPFCVQIQNEDTKSQFLLATESEYERDKWEEMLCQSARITWRNAQLGNAIIQQLERQGLQVAKEKQNYIDKLKDETEESMTNKRRVEELVQVNDELEKEKLKMERLVLGLKNEYDILKDELSKTSDALCSVEDLKQELHISTKTIQKNLEELEKEKRSIEEKLHEQQKATSSLSKKKKVPTATLR